MEEKEVIETKLSIKKKQPPILYVSPNSMNSNFKKTLPFLLSSFRYMKENKEKENFKTCF